MLFMLRGRSRNTIRLIHHPPSRSYAQSPIPKLSEKIQAYPFLLDINVAQVYARELIANLLHKPGVVKKIKTLLGLSFGRHYIQPKTRAALYFPAWIVDSETKVKLNDSTELPIPIYMDQSYFPGLLDLPRTIAG
ncbi:hypothetical protein QCA50_005806 [Cerrena zonata]|uniref:Uncharacterized protein n=1 Tax=Cerrena zonata TaxID=2478898 RepID=A0AAW0GG78_9APHY